MCITRFLALVIGASFLLSGCNIAKNINNSLFDSDETNNSAEEKTVSLNTAQKRYNEAFDSMSRSRYRQALEQYQGLIIQYPFGQITEKAKLDALFVLHQLRETNDAIKLANSFITQYPTHKNVEYAYYMKGIILFPKKKSALGRTFGSNALRNTSRLLEAYVSFEEFIDKFPRSEQAPDAKQRMVFLENAIAENEFEVAEFYSAKKAYVAVINRCQYVIENHSQTPSARDALLLMRDTYKKMGLTELVQDTQNVIDANDMPGKEPKELSKGWSWPKLKMPTLFKKKNKT